MNEVDYNNYELYEADNGFDTAQYQDAYDDMKGADNYE